MTNTNCCEAGCGVEYCGSAENTELREYYGSYIAIGLMVLAVVLIGAAIASNFSIVGSTMLDGTYLGY